MSEHYPEHETLITAIPEIHEIHVSRQPPEEGWHVMRYRDAELTERMANSLSQMCVEFGPGVHSTWDITERTGIEGTTIASLGKRMETIGRLDILERPVRSFDVRLGSFAVAMRKATPEEHAAREKPADIAYEARVRAVTEADSSKTDLRTMDHALITVDADRYYVDLAAPESGLLVRMVEALRAEPERRFTPNTLMATVWEAMHTNERRALTDDEKRIYGNHPTAFKAAAERYVNTILPTLGIICSADTYARLYSLAHAEISVDIHDLPQQQHLAAKRILPYEGLQKPEIKDTRQEALALVEPMAEMYARVTNVDPSTRMQAHEALDLLHKVMLRDGKRALALVLEASEDPTALADAINNVHNYVRRILGASAYGTARRENIIRGYGAGVERVLQQSGRRNLAGVKWYIGAYEDPEGSVEPN